MKSFIYAAGLSLCLVGLAQADQKTPDFVSTQAFLETCSAKASQAEQAFCFGYAQGVYETYVVSRHSKRNPHFICIEDKTLSRTQVLSNFTKWVDANPQLKEKTASDALLRYLRATYPCKTKR